MLPDFLCRPLIMLFGVLYPGYMSFKVLKTKRSTNYGIWLMYWITFSLFTSVETITDLLVGPWFPFYNELKLLMLYMTYPTSDSSLTYVYTNILNPFLKKHEKNIDAQIKQFKRGGLQTLMTTGKKFTNVLLTLAMKGFQLYGGQIGLLQSINTNINTNIIEQTEPDGDINWQEVISDDSDDESNSSDYKVFLAPPKQTIPEEPDYTFSNMYGHTQINENENGPPSSNTRRRKKSIRNV